MRKETAGSGPFLWECLTIYVLSTLNPLCLLVRWCSSFGGSSPVCITLHGSQSTSSWFSSGCGPCGRDCLHGLLVRMLGFSNANFGHFKAEEAMEKQGCSWCFSSLDTCHVRMSSVILQREPTRRQVMLLLMVVNLILPAPFNTYHSTWSIFSYHFSWNMFFCFLFILFFSLPHP